MEVARNKNIWGSLERVRCTDRFDMMALNLTSENWMGLGLGLGPFKSVPQVSLGWISCPSVSLKILKCPWVSLNFSEVSLTPRDTLDSTVSFVFSWCPSKLLSVPYVSFKYLKCLSSLGTLLISYCSSKDEDCHQYSPNISIP